MTKLVEVEGIGEMHAASLERAGVSTVEGLLDAAGSIEGRTVLAEKTGVTPQRVLEWVNRADLMRINGVGSEYSDLLEAAGIDTVPALATCRPEYLADRLQEVNASKKLVRKVPSTSEVENWVEQAKRLPPKVTHGTSEPSEPARRVQRSSFDAILAELRAADQAVVDPKISTEEFAFRRAILDLISEAAETFGGLGEALAWLKAPNRSIGDATPESLLDKGPDGVAEARAILLRLEEGMFS